MSEEKFEQEEPKEEDVEAHRRKHLTDEAPGELGDDDSDDVEAHRKRALTDELKDSDEGSDDFELHRKRA
jgi:hypothetical protein